MRSLSRKWLFYLKSIQNDRGGWPLFHGGKSNISATVKAYFALKLAGEDPHSPLMCRARTEILRLGGAERSNVFTRCSLALFGQIPWRAVPVTPVEIILCPSWFPFHLNKVAYWTRTVVVPLTILLSLKACACNPNGVNIREIFHNDPDKISDYINNVSGTYLGALFVFIDRCLRLIEPLIPKAWRQYAIRRAVAFIIERLNGEEGLGAIFPAMANALMAFAALGYPKDHPDREIAKRALRKLVVEDDRKAYCQPCFSPVWDTGLALQALMEAGTGRDSPKVKGALDWLVERQITGRNGDYNSQRPDLVCAGWAFQYRNDHYPDVDDTAVVGIALDRAEDIGYESSISSAEEWILGMQSRNGGWGAFDIDNTYAYLNHIPFADHGALLDPPTADVTGRCLGFLSQRGYSCDHPAIVAGRNFLLREQEADGSWFGRWGTNYIYGTWSVLNAFNIMGEDMTTAPMQRAIAWLKERQNADGGWGEDGATYFTETRCLCKESTPSQTSWAVLGLMAAGEVDSEHVARGIHYLLNCPREGSRWQEDWHTAVGFPRVFYLRYHGYAAFFPLWALARYRNLMSGNRGQPIHGM